jgi:hypothetical protein
MKPWHPGALGETRLAKNRILAHDSPRRRLQSAKVAKELKNHGD